MNNKSILIIDDTSVNRDIIAHTFSKNGYNIIEAINGKEGIKIIDEKQDEIAIIFLDIYMPEIDGFKVLEYIKTNKIHHKIPILVITGDSSADTQLKAYELGATDFIYKPFSPKIMLRRAKNLIDLYTYKAGIESTLDEKTKQLEEYREEIKETNEMLIDTLSTVVEFRNLESGEHIKRVKAFTNVMARAIMLTYPEYELDDEAVDIITSASALHDIGKIAIPDSILLKPGRFTEEEFAEMKNHTIYGGKMLQQFVNQSGRINKEFYETAYNIALYHHERYDGKGYPYGLIGDEIPISAQIVSIADVFDALVSKRVYKEAYSVEDSMDMIIRGECGIVSDKIIECFISCKNEMIKLVNELKQ